MRSIIIFAFVSICFFVHAQSSSEIIITGRVIDEEKQGLPGVSIFVKGTKVEGMADADGNFRFLYDKKEQEVTLVFSFIGYITQERVLKLDNEENNVGVISLELDYELLDKLSPICCYGSPLSKTKPDTLRSQKLKKKE